MADIAINADDFGLTDGICRSIVMLLDAGAITNTTIMACVPGSAERVRNFRTALQGHAGVHLQLTGEKSGGFPVLPPSEIPTLVDPVTGLFRQKDDYAGMDPLEVEKEWEAQITKVTDLLGQTPTHLDSHHGRHRIPAFTPVYLRLAAKYGLSVRGGYDGSERIDGTAYGVQVSRRCEIDWTGQNLGADILKKMLGECASSLEAGEVLELVTHPGFNDDELRAASSWNAVRENDHAVLLQLAREGWYAQAGLRLVPHPLAG